MLQLRYSILIGTILLCGILHANTSQMNKQSYRDHLRFYTPHHFIFYPLTGLLVIGSVMLGLRYEEYRLAFTLFAVCVLLMIWLSFMLRQHYALTLQDRVVRLEMRLRYYQLTNIRFEVYESKLSFKQVAALRFASDEELPALVQRTLNEDLSPDAIKKNIKNWIPDDNRV